MAVVYHPELAQGSLEWHAARCGLLTASEMHLIITPTLKAAPNEKERTHLYELLAQRVTKYVEPAYISDSMLRGMQEEVDAIEKYSDAYEPIQRTGFVTNDRWGFTIGYSPDALVGKDGLLECKSRRAKFQVQTIVDWAVPAEFVIQIQTGLLVSERKWLDFVSYCGGLPMFILRCYPIPEVQEAIVNAATAFEERLAKNMTKYAEISAPLIPTERKIYEEMHE